MLILSRATVQQIAVILQHEIQNSKTKIYIVSFQMALELGYLKGGYVNFWFCCSGFVLQDHCNLLYYSSVLVHFPPSCYYCGLGEDSLVNDDELKELKEMYAVVYPICFICQSDGKKPHCKQPSNLAKRRKT